MAKNDIRNGQAEYGIRHVVEEEMRAAGDGVFGKARRAPANKMAPAPDNKSLDDMTKAELLAEAERRGVEVSSSDTKAEIIAALGK